jgi:hypothetical protein
MTQKIKIVVVSMSLFFGIELSSQTYQVDTIIYNGNTDKFLNFVYLGDGYTETEIDVFLSDVETSVNYVFNETPFNEYRNYFNVFAIFTSSQESGAEHPRLATDCPPLNEHPLVSVNTQYSSTFDYYNIHRLLVPDFAEVYQIIYEYLPLFDQVFMLVNEPHYGGSGASGLATTSRHTIRQ